MSSEVSAIIKPRCHGGCGEFSMIPVFVRLLVTVLRVFQFPEFNSKFHFAPYLDFGRKVAFCGP